MARENVTVFIIDPQRSFMKGGSLAVDGAIEDMKRLGTFIDKMGRSISNIATTLDSHNVNDVGHPAMWIDGKGNNPDPFTVITHDDLLNGRWLCRYPQYREWFLQYTKELEAKGKYPLIVWPEHCLIGSDGHSIQEDLFESLRNWSFNTGRNLPFFVKGTCPFTEHYSGIQAEVPYPQDNSTQFNSGLVHNVLGKADKIIVAGEALSHCVLSTLGDVLANLPTEMAKKFYLLEDCTSSVTGFEQQGLDFLSAIRGQGVNILRSTDF